MGCGASFSAFACVSPLTKDENMIFGISLNKSRQKSGWKDRHTDGHGNVMSNTTFKGFEKGVKLFKIYYFFYYISVVCRIESDNQV